jgi:putative transposase
MYLAIVMDLYSRRIVGRPIDKSYTLRQPPKGPVIHSHHGSQYTSKRFGKLIKGYGLSARRGDTGACWDNAVLARFFGSLKQDGIFIVA